MSKTSLINEVDKDLPSTKKEASQTATKRTRSKAKGEPSNWSFPGSRFLPMFPFFCREFSVRMTISVQIIPKTSNNPNS